MATEAKKNVPIETAISNDIANLATEIPDTTESEGIEQLDARAELFVRRVSDAVTKSIADIIKPPESTPIVPEIVETSAPKKKRVKATLTILDWLLQ